ncbi:hypothetical protein ACOSP7_023405 [Xanthoceras sorbifolium]
MADTSHPQTIRLMEKLKNRDITVLVNGRSTHNFINQTVVSKLGLPLVCDTTFQVMMANKEKIDCSGKCISLTLFIQDQPITTDFYVLVQWLETLGPVETDYQKLTMSFQLQGKRCQFQGVKQAETAPLQSNESHQ